MKAALNLKASKSPQPLSLSGEKRILKGSIRGLGKSVTGARATTFTREGEVPGR